MELIGPALGHYVNGRETIAVLGGGVPRLDAYLFDGVEGGVVVAAVVVSWGSGSRAIQQKVHIVLLGAVHSDSLAIRLAGATAGIHAGY